MRDTMTTEQRTSFRYKLEKLISRESRESGSNTPDFILAEFLTESLQAFDRAVARREEWYGRDPMIIRESVKYLSGKQTVMTKCGHLLDLTGLTPEQGAKLAVEHECGCLESLTPLGRAHLERTSEMPRTNAMAEEPE